MPSALIVGAGVFGAWTAHALYRRGWSVTLVDQHGPANSRASSGGETRIIRSGYGDIALYAAWARDSLPSWLELQRAAGEPLFAHTGALFLGGNLEWLQQTRTTLAAERIAAEWLEPDDIAARFPQLEFADSAGAVFEPQAGVLFARRAVQALVRTLTADGVSYEQRVVDPANELARSRQDAVIFACGPWLPSLFPDLLGDAIVPTRQEVLLRRAGRRHAIHRGPASAWVAFDEGVYGLPDLEHRGVKVAFDAHGDVANPERMDRTVSPASVARMRDVLARRLPALADAPLIEARVCQYENTTNGHLLIDRLAGHDRVWIAGGGSGHGFKHGPMVGDYLAGLIEGTGRANPTLSLDGRPARRRSVF